VLSFIKKWTFPHAQPELGNRKDIMAALPLRASALGAFRTVMRATQKAFKDDVRMLTESRSAVRSMYVANSSLVAPDQIQAAVKEALDAAQFLREQIVQIVHEAPGEAGAVRLDGEQLHNKKFLSMQQIDATLLERVENSQPVEAECDGKSCEVCMCGKRTKCS
jgi:hypothetical protein